MVGVEIGVGVGIEVGEYDDCGVGGGCGGLDVVIGSGGRLPRPTTNPYPLDILCSGYAAAEYADLRCV
uniref:Uncharacterized protein n=1 Tax=Rhizophora mucronata TaxID=61149 RepID=A0A2P2QL70_RHIMU